MRVRANPVWNQTGLHEMLCDSRFCSTEQVTWTGGLRCEGNGSFVVKVWRFELLVARASLTAETACGVVRVF
jgi:hypothetical protein